MLEVLVGFMVAAWVFTLVACAYLGWRYVWKPWHVLRTDIVALNEKLDGVIESIRNKKTMAMTDEELASVERRLRASAAGRYLRYE